MSRLISLCFFAFHGAAHAEAYSDKFTELTGIQPGAYRLVKGPKACYDGDLELKDKVSKLTNAPGIAFVLNSHSLASFLGGADEGGERELKWNSDSTVTASRVEYHKRGTFEGRPVKWDFVLIPKPDGFVYTTEIKGKTVTCELSR